MIEQVKLKYFKRFKEQSFDLDATAVVLAGPNNAGKTTLLQAIATWHFAFREWQKKNSYSAARRRTGVALTRKEFLSVPMHKFNLLWTDTSTALKKDEGGGRGAATPRLMQITLEGGNKTNKPWQHTMEFRHANSELIYAKPTDPNITPEGRVVYVPPFSGIETEEKIHAPAYQDWLIGQGKPGDIIRNLLAEACSRAPAWQSLLQDVEAMFGYRLLNPQYEGRPFILCEYLPGIPPKKGYGGLPKLELASAGSGFLQTLLLLSFFYARPATVLLVDEPDAHLHVSLQKQIYDHLRAVAEERKCQIIVATHSEVIVDNTAPDKIISFYGPPRKLVNTKERDGVREALRRLTSTDILLAENSKVLYVEDHSDFNILRAWARRLNHPLKDWFSEPFYVPLKGSKPKQAKDHFFALSVVNKQMLGVLVLDSDNRDIAEHDVSADRLKIIRWKRYEIENYLVHYALIKRFIEKKTHPLFAEAAVKSMLESFPPIMLTSPLQDAEWLNNTAASKRILPDIFSAADMDLTKQEYYKLAEEMEQGEIPPEVQEQLDAMHEHWQRS